MSKAFFVAVLVLAVLAIAFAANSNSEPKDFPRVVARLNLKNQANVIPTTTIFTPGANGLYRMSATMLMTSAGNTTNFWQLDFSWTDDVGQELNNGMLELEDTIFQNSGDYATGFAGSQASPFAFRAVAGQPVSFDISGNGGTPNGTYALYLVIERLE